MNVSNKKTYLGPRDVDDVSWAHALSLVSLVVPCCHRRASCVAVILGCAAVVLALSVAVILGVI